MEFGNKLIVITGGAGGIARETAQLLLAGGAELLLIDGMGHDVPPALFETLTAAIRRTADRAG